MDVDILLTMVSQSGGPVKGEASDGKIKLENFAFDVKRSFSQDGNFEGRPRWSDVTCFKAADVSTPVLIELLARNIKIKSAIISVHKSGGSQKPFFSITLKDALVSSYKNLGYDGDQGFEVGSAFKSKLHIVREVFTLNFSRVEIDYFPQNTDGSMFANTRFEMDIRDQ
jgi:type VI secretion system secreted protein Hcp